MSTTDRKYYILIVIMVLFAAGCNDLIEMPDPGDYEERLVVNGMLIAGMNVDSIRVNTTADITEPYDPVSSRVSGALVILTHVNGADTLSEYNSRPGIYYHPDAQFRVMENTTYSLFIHDGIHPDVSATTTVPGEMVFDRFWDSDDRDIPDLPDTIRYVPAGNNADFLTPRLFSFSVMPASSDQAYPAMIRLVNISLDAREETMITEDDSLKAFLFKWNGLSTEEEDLQRRIALKAAQSFNSVDFDAQFLMSWIYFGFYGPQLLLVLSMDQSYYNYHVGNLEGPPRNPNYLPVSNVTGGYGLFSSSSISLQSTRVYYLKRP